MIEFNADTKLIDVLEYGQGYDDEIAEVIEAFVKFRNGYYDLLNYGDSWWGVFNQSTTFDKVMKSQWEKIEEIDMMDILDRMEMAMVGTYINFGKFARVVIDANKKGEGFRHIEKKKSLGETE